MKKYINISIYFVLIFLLGLVFNYSINKKEKLNRVESQFKEVLDEFNLIKSENASLNNKLIVLEGELSLVNLNKEIEINKNFVKTNYHNLLVTSVNISSLTKDWESTLTSSGFINNFNDKIVFISGIGEIALIDNLNFQTRIVKSNLNEIVELQDYPRGTYSIKDTYIDGKNIYVSMLSKKISGDINEDCYTFEIFYSNLSQSFNDLNFTSFIKLPDCIPEGVMNGHITGGRIEKLDDKTLLLSVGDFNFRNDFPGFLAQDPNSYFGKILTIDQTSKEIEIFSMGHRNPQGLFVDYNNNIFETEHGPKGGDEINLITEGNNYGWASVSYGTPMTYFGLNQDTFAYYGTDKGDHQNFSEPLYSFVPSIGISQLIRLPEKSSFYNWNNDLIIASMKKGVIYRIRLSKSLDRVITIEPIINLKKRTRDILLSEDGKSIFLLNEDPSITKIELYENIVDTNDTVPFGELLNPFKKINQDPYEIILEKQ